MKKLLVSSVPAWT